MSTSANDDTNHRETNTGDGDVNQSKLSEIHDSASPPKENDLNCPSQQHVGKKFNGIDQSEVEMPKNSTNKGSGNMEEDGKPSKVDIGAKDNTEEQEERISQYQMENENDNKGKFDEEEKNTSVDSERPLGGDIKEKNITEEMNGLLEGVEGENYDDESGTQ